MAHAARIDPRPQLPSGGRLGGHLPILDGVRGLAILLVMLYHMTVMDGGIAFDRGFKFAMAFGWVGVDLFFVLSGFLITGILFDSKGSGGYFKNFYARRTLRIFPLYYAVVFFCLVVIPKILPAVLPHVLPDSAVQLLMSKIDRFGYVTGYEHWFWLYLCNVPMAYLGTYMHGILGVCWSLAIEEQFYLIWPAVIYLCSRKAAIRVCVILLVLALAWRLALQFVFQANHVAVYVSTPSRMDALAAGALLALVMRRPPAKGGFDLARWARTARAVVIVAVPIAVAIAVIETFGPHYDPDEGRGVGHTPFFLTLGLTLLSAIFLSLMVLVLASRPGTLLHAAFSNPVIRTFGKYAYALYLFHQPIRAIFRDLVYGPRGTGAPFKFFTLGGSELPGQLLYYALCIGATLLAAIVSWYCFESPLLKLKKYFPSGADPKAMPFATAAPAAPISTSITDPPSTPAPASHSAKN